VALASCVPVGSKLIVWVPGLRIELHDVRIRHACVLLHSTEMSIAEVAFEAGYGSYSTFIRVFQEQKGMSPTAYRKALAQ
jgi:AraC-like DNA-binding protein